MCDLIRGVDFTHRVRTGTHCTKQLLGLGEVYTAIDEKSRKFQAFSVWLSNVDDHRTLIHRLVIESDELTQDIDQELLVRCRTPQDH